MKNNPHFTTPVYDFFDKSKMLRNNLGKNSHFINLDVVSDATIVLLFRLNYVNRKNRQPGPTVELHVNISATTDERRVRVTVTRTDDQSSMGQLSTARANPTVKYDNTLWCADKADARNLAETVSLMCNHMLTAEFYNFSLNELN